ncbi:hypothetical protein GCM10010219_37200 [Streptomyces netropsis]|nr:hypothetical protein GCM10010219_37200 [Streptomyces netropsis]
MEMSESYATTVAAVAPVIWAIGTVEVHQVLKRVWAIRDERDRRLAEAQIAMAAVDDAAGLARVRNDLAAVDKQSWRALPAISLYVVWVCLGMAMALCTINALNWLSEAGGPGKVSGTDPRTAEFCLLALAAGLSFITLLPVGTATTEATRSLRRVRAKQKELTALEAAAVSRIEARRPSASRTSAGTSPPP